MSITDHLSSPSSEGDDVGPPLCWPGRCADPAVLVLRRLRGALFDLGLLDVLSKDWVHPCPDGLAFGHLDLKVADRLSASLEAISTGRAGGLPLAGPGQLTLFGGGAK